MRRLFLVAALAVVALAVGSIALRNTGDPSAPTIDSTPTTAAQHGPSLGSSTAVAGIAHGWSHDDAGAEHAAIAAVRATGPIAKAGFITRADLIRSITSTAFGPKLAASSSTQLAEMTAELGAVDVSAADIVFEELPLRSRIVSADAEQAVVEVWSLLVIGVAGLGAPRQLWRTVTIDLLWERDDWRIDRWATVPGPTPALAPVAAVSDVAAVAAALSWHDALPSGSAG
jgi:hypothetical protein